MLECGQTIQNYGRNMASYLILGRGVGKAIAYHLAQQPDTERIAILDKDKSVLKIGRLLVGKPCEFLISDIESLDLPSLFSKFDVIISAMPASQNLNLAKTAIEAGRGFCDLGGVVDITQRQISQLNNLALKNGVSVIPDCGLMPGLGILMARKLVYELDNAKSIAIYVGGIPQKPRPPIYYQRVFNEHGLASICYSNSPVLEDGQIRHLPPFSGHEQIFVPELKKFSSKFDGWVEAFTTAGASIAPWTFKEMGVENFLEKTIRWPGFVDFVRNIPEARFIEKISPHIKTPVTSENPDLVWMKVDALGYSGRTFHKKSYSLLDLYDSETGLTAMERTTGFPTAIIARMIANSQSNIGVHTPETAFTRKQLKSLWEQFNKHLCIKET